MTSRETLAFLIAAVLLIALISAYLPREEAIAGAVRVIDGDSLYVGSTEVRLFGVDAFEGRQTCQRDGAAWPCGEAAADALRALTDGRDVVTVGEGAVPSAVWSAAVRDASPARGTPEACPVVTVPVVDEAAAIGDLWASWPPTADVPADAATTMGVCARLVGPRLAGCAWSVPPARDGTPRLVGEGPAMTAVREHLARAARCPFPVLLLGESGSGKELAARTVHDAGETKQRRDP